MSDPTDLPALKQKILALTREYAAARHRSLGPGYAPEALDREFIAGETTVPYAGRVFDEDEVEAAVSSTLDFWLTLGPEGEGMERELAEFLGVKRTLLVNSGSSANLLAVSALTTHKLPPEKRLLPGDEVITCAAGFPTTVAPIVQNGLVPVFIDNHPVTGNANLEYLEEAYVPGKTKAVMLAHALGNPFDLGTVLAFCRQHNLWLIEDNCDALGCSYTLPAGHALNAGTTEQTRFTGTWGDLSTQSFYPPHHLTMGEGGAVNIVRDMKLKVYVESFRDWGRDCWCASGKDNTCNKRFGWQLGELPEGYDHKYIYSHLGYNLKPLDPQAAIGRQQLKKLPAFVEARKRNWETLRRGLADLEEFFEFSLPTHATSWTPDGFTWDETGCRTECSWFGFLLLVRESAPFSNTDLARALDAARIGNRMLFGGNLVRQPAFLQLRKDRSNALRTIGDLKGADRIMNQSLFLGTYPGLTSAMMDYEVDSIRRFVRAAQ
jgi:CDP-6-deoxy-D-xylo-4-hexulose-3-dehydrase